MIVLPLSGGADVTVGDTTFALAGRDERVHRRHRHRVPADRIAGAARPARPAASIALPGARADRALPFRFQPASAVDVSLRGSGSAHPAGEQLRHGRGHGVREDAGHRGADAGVQLVVLPAAQARRGRRIGGTETELEEIYYYLFASAAPAGQTAARGAKAVGYQRVYGTTDRPIELLEEVTDGDTVLVPHGWHGPSIASPSHHMYYLNVMAGPGAGRAWGISDDPNHGWVRADLGATSRPIRGCRSTPRPTPTIHRAQSSAHRHRSERSRRVTGEQPTASQPRPRGRDRPADRRAGRREVPRSAVLRAGRRAAQVLRRLLRHLRARQRGRPRARRCCSPSC